MRVLRFREVNYTQCSIIFRARSTCGNPVFLMYTPCFFVYGGQRNVRSSGLMHG